MKENHKTYGFIRAEDGTDTFVIPSACANFGHQLPAVGTKVIFRKVVDAKTNKIRADNATLILQKLPHGNMETNDAAKRRDPEHQIGLHMQRDQGQ